MADTKIPPGAQKTRHFVDEFLLRFLVEIDHHVSAENEIEWSFKRIGLFKVQTVKSDDPFDMRSYLVFRSPISVADFVEN